MWHYTYTKIILLSAQCILKLKRVRSYREKQQLLATCLMEHRNPKSHVSLIVTINMNFFSVTWSDINMWDKIA